MGVDRSVRSWGWGWGALRLYLRPARGMFRAWNDACERVRGIVATRAPRARLCGRQPVAPSSRDFDHGRSGRCVPAFNWSLNKDIRAGGTGDRARNPHWPHCGRTHGWRSSGSRQAAARDGTWDQGWRLPHVPGDSSQDDDVCPCCTQQGGCCRPPQRRAAARRLRPAARLSRRLPPNRTPPAPPSMAALSTQRLTSQDDEQQGRHVQVIKKHFKLAGG